MPIKIKTPTINEPQKNGWRILTTALGCGSRILQGWSAGIGIKGNENFEEKFFNLLYASKLTTSQKEKQVEKHWHAKRLDRDVDAPIAVSAQMYQYLTVGDTYIATSTSDWVDRFEAFVTKHKLGEFTRSHTWQNSHYRGADNNYFIWTWNGNCPKPEDVGLNGADYV